MKEYPTNQIKNIVLLGGSGSGKTTFAEAMAFEGKVIDRRGSIEADSTLSDYTDIEHTYKRSIYPTLLFTEYNGYKINIIDTPGSDDFCGGLFSAFKVADVGVLIINGQNGFEAGTEIQMRYARRHSKPVIIFVNQLDHEKSNWESSIDSIFSNSQAKPVIVQYPVNPGLGFDAYIDVLLMKQYTFSDNNGTRHESDIPAEEMAKATELHNTLVEAAAENDDSLMELFFEKGSLTEDEVRSGLKLGIAKRDLVPIFCGSARKDIGTKRMLEFITNVAPGPIKAPNFRTTDGGEIAPKEDGPTVIFVFRTVIEPHLGEVSLFRVITGILKEGMELTNQKNGSKEKIAQLFVCAGKNRTKVSSLSAGDIGCTVKLKSVRTNDTLCSSNINKEINHIRFPEHRFRTAVRPVNVSDEEKLGEALNKAHFEDPSIVIEYSKELKQIILYGQGEHHLNILKNSLSKNNKIEVEYFAPRIPYRETITKISAADYRHKKQSGGAGQFGEVHIVIEPHTEGAPQPTKFKIDGKEIVPNIKGIEEVELDWGGKLIFYNAIVGGAIDARFFPAVLKGLMEKMEEGPLTGSYARDIRVVLYDGKMHPVDSNEISFRLAARNAFKDAFRNAGPKIMEPIYSVEILVPSDRMGDIISDLQNRRAIIEGMSSEKGFELLTARVPLAELYRYSTTLSSLSSGRATYSMKFLSYEQVPSEVQAKLLKEYIDTDTE